MFLVRSATCPVCEHPSNVSHDDRTRKPSALHGNYAWTCPHCSSRVVTPLAGVGSGYPDPSAVPATLTDSAE